MSSRFSETLFSPAALCRFFLTTAAGLMLDLWTKSLAVEQLKDSHRTVDFIHGWLQFEYIENPGAVFGIAPGRTGMFIAVSILAVVFLTYLFSTSAGKWFYQIILGLLLAGVLGNMYDRIEMGQVRDMIHALPGWHWPDAVRHVLRFLQPEVFPYIFNVADTLLCTGVGLMLIYSFFSTTDEAKTTPGAKTVEA
jgi:signal peptidase II